jgi:ATP-binding cassette subfamily F protein 3
MNPCCKSRKGCLDGHMSLVSVLNVSVTFIGKQIFGDLVFQVEPGERIGLVGPNGSGKTTLLRLLTGEISPDKGEVRVSKGTRIGYLAQDAQEGSSAHLLASVLESIPGRVSLERDLEQLEGRLKTVTEKGEQMRLAERIAEIHQEIDRLDLQFPRHEAEKILLGLGFGIEELDRPVSSLSGGWKTRAALAGLLYRKPDLLLLDEPTNHLDIPSIRWLEQFLQGFKGAMVLVSHDRDFLNRQVRRITSFEVEGVRFYGGNYDFYLKAREEESRTLAAQARNQEQKIKEAQKFIERFRVKASKARQAQSKIKLVKKMELVQTHRKRKTIHFSFPEVPRSGREVVSLKGISKSFGEKPLYRDVNLSVFRGERVAVIGPNGCGKTTLLRMVAGETEPDRGEIVFGQRVSMGYFAQHHSEMLSPENSVIEEVYQVVPHESVSFVRGVCGAFLFPGEEVEKKVQVLSGGERARVSLAKLLVKPGNFMVMDEPTNHLDLVSSEVLIDALARDTGTLLFVSHNQSFINRLATKVWDIRNGEIQEYPGNLDEYYDHLARLETAREGSSGTLPGGRNAGNDTAAEKGSLKCRDDRKADKRARAERRREIRESLDPIMSELEKVEARIAELESRQKNIETTLSDVTIFKDEEKSVPLLNEYHRVREDLNALLIHWEDCQVKLEDTKKQLGI